MGLHKKMRQLWRRIEPYDIMVSGWMGEHSIRFLRISLGIIFIWFGTLKLLHVSPATDLALNTVYWIDPHLFLPFLSWWEIIIGVCFLIRPLVRFGILLLVPHMAGTFMPLLVLPEVVFQGNPFFLTMEGQYIVKNLLIISAAMTVGSKVRERDMIIIKGHTIKKERANN